MAEMVMRRLMRVGHDLRRAKNMVDTYTAKPEISTGTIKNAMASS